LFQEQPRRGGHSNHCVDLLGLNGEDFRPLPLSKRQGLAWRGLLAQVSAGIALNEPDADGAAVRGMAQFSWPNKAVRLVRHWAPLNLVQ
jgi:hypothetical protein